MRICGILRQGLHASRNPAEKADTSGIEAACRHVTRCRVDISPQPWFARIQAGAALYMRLYNNPPTPKASSV